MFTCVRGWSYLCIVKGEEMGNAKICMQAPVEYWVCLSLSGGEVGFHSFLSTDGVPNSVAAAAILEAVWLTPGSQQHHNTHEREL